MSHTEFQLLAQAALLLSSLIVATACWHFCLSYNKSQNLSFVPSPPGASWLWGHEKMVFSSDTGTVYTSWFQTLKTSIVRIKAGLFKPDILVLADPLAVSYILSKRIYYYPHSEVVRPRIARMLGKSLGWVEGEAEHKRMRQLVSPSLSASAIKAGAQRVFEAAERLRESLDTLLKASGDRGEAEKVINIHEWSGRVTLDVIGRYAFDHDFDGGCSTEASEILDAWRNMVKMVVSAHGFIALMLLRRFRVLNFIPLKAIQAQANVRVTIHQGVATEMLKRHQSEGNLGRGKVDDLLSTMLSAHDEGRITKDELMDHISMFVIAGSETTSQSIASAVWELGRNQDIQDRLRAEIQQAPEALTYEHVSSNMPYLDAVTREALRLHPAAPYLERCAMEDDSIPLRHPIADTEFGLQSQVPVKAGQTIIIPIHSFNRLDTIWSDGSVFRPERWHEALPPQDDLPHGWSSTLTFSEGPRNCPGFRLAIFELKVILATLVRYYKFTDTGVRIRNRFASSMNPLVEGQEQLGPMIPVKISKLQA